MHYEEEKTPTTYPLTNEMVIVQNKRSQQCKAKWGVTIVRCQDSYVAIRNKNISFIASVDALAYTFFRYKNILN